MAKKNQDGDKNKGLWVTLAIAAGIIMIGLIVDGFTQGHLILGIVGAIGLLVVIAVFVYLICS